MHLLEQVADDHLITIALLQDPLILSMMTAIQSPSHAQPKIILQLALITNANNMD